MLERLLDGIHVFTQRSTAHRPADRILESRAVPSHVFAPQLHLCGLRRRRGLRREFSRCRHCIPAPYVLLQLTDADAMRRVQHQALVDEILRLAGDGEPVLIGYEIEGTLRHLRTEQASVELCA